MVQLLLERGARVDSKDLWGNSPIVFAVWGGNLEVLQALLAHGADPNAKRPWPSGQTALKFAEFRKDTELIAILWDAGAHE